MNSLSVRAFVRTHHLSLSIFGVVALSAIIVPACTGGGDATSPGVTAINVLFAAARPTEVRAGQQVQMAALAEDQDGHILNTAVSYSLAAADAAVATIDAQSGLVTAKSPLSAASTTITVTATVTGATAPVTNGVVTLNVRTRIDNIIMTPASQSLAVGQTLQLAPSVTIASGSPQTAPTLTYTATPQSAAISVSATGVVTALAPTPAGSPIQITASAEGITSSPAAITVTLPAPVATTATLEVTSSPSTGNVIVGATRQFAFKVFDQFNSQMTQFTTAAWTSSNTAVAIVSSSGLATCVTAGTATISAVPTGTGLRADATLTCAAAPSVATSMAIVVTSTPSTGSVFVGQTRQYAIEVRDQNNAVITSATSATWSFLPATTVASISASGLVTCLSAGTPTVHAVGPLNGSGVALTADAALTCAANSGNPFASIVLTPRVITVAAAGTTQVTASFLDAGGQPTANGCTVGMAVDASPVASVSVNGLVGTVTGVGAGTSTLRAFCSSGGSVATLARVQVTQPPLNIAFMLLDTYVYLPSSSASNNSFTFTATARDATNTVISGATVVWAIQGGNTATYSIDQTGKVTVTPSVASGFRGGAIITATSGGQKDYGWFTYGDAGTIRGTVSSVSGQDVGPTTVTATNNSTGAVTTSPVSVTGRFFLVGLEPGTYTVSINGNAPGRSQTINSVVVTAGSTNVITVTPFP